MRDVTIATFCSSRHQDPGQGVLWKFWKCTKVKQENKGGAPSVLKCNNPADLEALNSLILKKVSSRVYWSKYHFNLNNSQVISLKSVPNVYTEQMKLNQRSLSSDVTAVDNYSEVDLQNLFAFLAALAALGLPWSLTYLLTVTFIVLDSKPSSPFQPERHVQHWYRPASRDLLSVIIPCASPSDRCQWGSLKDTLVLRSNKFRNVSRRFPL